MFSELEEVFKTPADNRQTILKDYRLPGDEIIVDINIYLNNSEILKINFY